MTRLWCIGLWAWLLCGAWQPAAADEFRPAYLQLTQIDAIRYDVLWKLPALDEATTLKLRPEFPAASRALTPVHSGFAKGTAVQRWRIQVDGGLAGQVVRFPDLATTRADVLVRLARLDGSTQLGRVTPAAPQFAFTASPSTFEVARTYTWLGVEHILMGFDHLLFVLALVLLVDGPHRLVATITAFTLAHSITLGLATLGFVHVPGPPVEALIALSIVFVASEIVHARLGREGLTRRFPWLVAFTFGLLHGLGFAGALAEVGLPELSIPVALLFFNVGVEVGQLLFVAAVLASMAGWRRAAHLVPFALPPWLWRVPAYGIGGLASFWVFERIAAF